MKKTISFVLVLLMLLMGSLSVYAAETDPEDASQVPSDVKGTVYEASVRMLMEKDVLSGYADGSFRPNASMERAEACAIVVKAMNPLGADLYTSQNKNTFSDMDGYEWAVKYVNYAVDKGVVSGVGNDRFDPAGQVSYNEMAAMLVNAVGYKAKDLSGSWPDNYVNKAKELMIFNDVTLIKDGNVSATRGDVALMTAVVADKIEVANKNRNATMVMTTDGAVDNGKLTNSSTRNYGMILDSSRSSVKFLMGNRIYELPTDSIVSIPKKDIYLGEAGNLYCLKLSDGIVKGISTDGTALGAKYFKELTPNTFASVTARDKTSVATQLGDFSVMDSTVFYVAEYDQAGTLISYIPGTLRDVEKGCKIRAFDLTDDKNQAADVAIIVKAADVK